MPLRQPIEIEDYDLKAKTLKDGGWTDLWHPDNWIMEVWMYDSTKDYNRMGCSTDVAYAGVIDRIVPLNIISRERQLLEYGEYLLSNSDNDSNLNLYLKETLPEFTMSSEYHMNIIEGVLTEAYDRIDNDNIQTLEEWTTGH